MVAAVGKTFYLRFKMINDSILGILVNSDKYFDFVYMLTEAACAKGRTVNIHLHETGLGLIFFAGFGRLSQMAKITICEVGPEKLATELNGRIPESVTIVSARNLAAMFKSWARYVVF